MNEGIPTRDECYAFLKQARCQDNVIRHCEAVEELALKMAELAEADQTLVSRGALLHDIGRGVTHGIAHAVEGGRIARRLGLSQDIALIIERHIGAGITGKEARNIGLPEKDYLPKTLEEKIVSHADNLIDDGEKKPVNTIVKRFETLGYEDVALRVIELHRDLSQLCGVDLDLI